MKRPLSTPLERYHHAQDRKFCLGCMVPIAAVLGLIAWGCVVTFLTR